MATNYNPYYSGGWQSGEEGGTPITPDALNHMDDGIADAYDYIQQSTADKAKKIFFNVATWADIYSKLSSLGAGETAPMLVGTAVVSLLTNGAVPSAGLTGTVGATNPSAGRYTFFAAHYGCNFSCMWEINGLTSASATPTVINFKKIEPNYISGTTETFDNAAIGASGFITSDSKSMTFFIDLPKSLEDITSISCSRFTGVIRGTKNYVDNVQPSSSRNWASTSGITCNAVKVSANKLRINITGTSSFANVDNNTPIYFIGTVTLSMT